MAAYPETPRKPRPKGPSPGVIDAILERKRRNPRFGYQRIAEQLALAFGIEIDKDTVRCESLILRNHWVMVVMDQTTRRIIGFGVRAGVLDGPAICRMFNDVLSRFGSLLRLVSSDHDPLFLFHRWRANLRILQIQEIKSVTDVPISHPFVERLIGTIQRAFLDHVPF